MFRIASTPSYTAPVSVDMPADHGKTKAMVFTAKFKRLSQAEIEALYEGINDKTVTDADIVHKVLLGWGNDVQDEEGNPLEFNSENLATLLDIYPVRPSIVKAFFGTIQGARTKN